MSLSSILSEDEARVLAKRKLEEGVPLAARRLLEPHLAAGGCSWETHALFGQACIDSNELAGALDLLAKPPVDDGSEWAFRAKLRFAQLLHLAGRNLEAMDRLAELAMLSPDDRDTVETLGFVLLTQGDADRALALFLTMCHKYPLTPRLAVGVLKALAAQGNLDAAEEFAQEADRILPRHPAITLQWTDILIKAKKLGEAEDKLKSYMRAFGPSKEIAVQLATIALIRDNSAEARKYFRMAYRFDPNDVYLRHLSEGERGVSGERAEDSYVAGLFDGYAAKFEMSLVGLGYRVPGLIHNLVRVRLPSDGAEPRIGDMLDLGCGTGLLGLVLADMKAGFWRGIDLSREMIEEARRKGIYDDLVVGEITACLKAEARRWHCIFAADVLCYFGDLSEVIDLVLARLSPGGFFAFTVEALPEGDTRGWVKNATGRYAHGEHYVRAVTSRAARVEIAREVLRMDREMAIDGLLVSGFAP